MQIAIHARGSQHQFVDLCLAFGPLAADGGALFLQVFVQAAKSLDQAFDALLELRARQVLVNQLLLAALVLCLLPCGVHLLHALAQHHAQRQGVGQIANPDTI